MLLHLFGCGLNSGWSLPETFVWLRNVLIDGDSNLGRSWYSQDVKEFLRSLLYNHHFYTRASTLCLSNTWKVLKSTSTRAGVGPTASSTENNYFCGDWGCCCSGPNSYICQVQFAWPLAPVSVVSVVMPQGNLIAFFFWICRKETSYCTDEPMVSPNVYIAKVVCRLGTGQVAAHQPIVTHTYAGLVSYEVGLSYQLWGHFLRGIPVEYGKEYIVW